MKKLATVIVIGIATAGMALAQPEAGGERNISLEDCILNALKNNLRLSAEVLAPEAAGYAVRRAGEIFLPQLTVGFNKSEQNSASFSFIDATGQVITNSSNYNAGISQVIPTGGQLDLSLRSYGQDTNRNFQTINPVYGSTLSFNFVQPLLRDFGIKTTRRQIIVAQHNRDISEAQLKQTLLDTVYSVEEAYWNLVFSRENLQVGKESLLLARDLLAKSERELEVGMIPPIELLSAKAEAARREADILQAEVEVRNAEDTLRRLINLPLERDAPPQALVPTEAPKAEPFRMSFEEAMGLAEMNRPDLESSRIQIRSRNLDLSYAKNQLLPGLSLEASYWSPGISGTQLLYQDDNPLTGVVIGEVPGGASLALKDAFNFKYVNWSVGMTIDIPLASAVSRAQYYQAKIEAERAVILLEDREQEVVVEIQALLRACETDAKKAQAYKIARELAEESLRAEEKKLRAGLSTNYTVLQFQRDLATAKSNELRALVDYNLSLAGISRATGASLRDRDITIAGRSPK